ncbi:MAG: hypothetical protein Q9201_002721 [Fulgogasparrea decipioides]
MGATSWYSEPMKHCDDRRSLLFRGEVLGGNSRINGMIYTRGSIGDYETWASTGHPEWAYEKVLPYFVKAETAMSRPKSYYRGDSAMGFGVIDDTNSPEALCDGISTLDSTVDENRQRVSTLEAYLPLKTTLERADNLSICTGVVVGRINFSASEVGHCAEQVTFQKACAEWDKVFSVKVKKEVVVSSGALGSPQILMLRYVRCLLSGEGSTYCLDKLILALLKAVLDLVNTWNNMVSRLYEIYQALAIPVAWEVPVTASLSTLAISPFRGALEFFKYVFFRKGILSLPIQVLSLFVRDSSLDDETATLLDGGMDNDTCTPGFKIRLPDLEIMPLAVSAVDDLEEHKLYFSKIGVFTLLATLLRPKSRGTVRLGSSNPHDRPKVNLGLLNDPTDFALARKAVRLALKLGDAMKAQNFPLLRGVSVPDSDKSRDNMDKFIRHRARTTYHYSSTCRMASEFDTHAPGVVDDSLRVHGTSNLRVCDASIFPQIIASHLMAPVVMVAEKCASMIKGV